MEPNKPPKLNLSKAGCEGIRKGGLQLARVQNSNDLNIIPKDRGLPTGTRETPSQSNQAHLRQLFMSQLNNHSPPGQKSNTHHLSASKNEGSQQELEHLREIVQILPVACPEIIQKDLFHSVCEICLSKHNFHGNEKLSCHLCSSTAHKKCYGLGPKTNLLPGHWFCQRCDSLIMAARTHSSKNPTILTPKNQAERATKLKQCLSLPACFICPSLQGIMKKDADDVWMHPFCVNWTPYVIVDTKGVAKNVSSQNMGICLFCLRSNGIIAHCAKPGCPSTFHLQCLRLSDNFDSKQIQKKTNSVGDARHIYCHSNELPSAHESSIVLTNNAFVTKARKTAPAIPSPIIIDDSDNQISLPLSSNPVPLSQIIPKSPTHFQRTPFAIEVHDQISSTKTFHKPLTRVSSQPPEPICLSSDSEGEEPPKIQLEKDPNTDMNPVIIPGDEDGSPSPTISTKKSRKNNCKTIRKSMKKQPLLINKEPVDTISSSCTDVCVVIEEQAQPLDFGEKSIEPEHSPRNKDHEVEVEIPHVEIPLQENCESPFTSPRNKFPEIQDDDNLYTFKKKLGLLLDWKSEFTKSWLADNLTGLFTKYLDEDKKMVTLSRADFDGIFPCKSRTRPLTLWGLYNIILNKGLKLKISKKPVKERKPRKKRTKTKERGKPDQSRKQNPATQPSPPKNSLPINEINHQPEKTATALLIEEEKDIGWSSERTRRMVQEGTRTSLSRQRLKRKASKKIKVSLFKPEEGLGQNVPKVTIDLIEEKAASLTPKSKQDKTSTIKMSIPLKAGRDYGQKQEETCGTSKLLTKKKGQQSSVMTFSNLIQAQSLEDEGPSSNGKVIYENNRILIEQRATSFMETDPKYAINSLADYLSKFSMSTGAHNKISEMQGWPPQPNNEPVPGSFHTRNRYDTRRNKLQGQTTFPVS